MYLLESWCFWEKMPGIGEETDAREGKGHPFGREVVFLGENAPNRGVSVILRRVME